jgi:predicted metal-dependent peptidase
MNKLQQARAKLLLRSPFFGTLIMTMPMKPRDDIPTAATDMKSIYYNPAFFDSLDTETIIFVLAHEVLHVALEHGLRLHGRNRQLWNMAADYCINDILFEDKFKLWDRCLHDKQYAGMSADHVYELLRKDKDENPGKYGPPPGGMSGSGQPGDEDGDGQPGGQGGMGRDLLEPEFGSAADQAEAQRGIQQRVAQAANMARMAGKLSAGLERLVDEILNPAVVWQDLLRDYMTRVTKNNESWAHRNRRFQHIYLPARHSTRMGTIAIIGDTSGSITNDELKRVGSEIVAISEAVDPELIRVLWADTVVAGEQEFASGDTITLTPMGGGGTDMRVPLDHVVQYDPEVVVLITDGHTPWPEVEPDFPLIVVCTTEVACPVGQVVRI